MGGGKTRTGYSRRNFLKSWGAFLAGGVIGCAPGLASRPRAKTADEPPPLPWKWAKIDPMEAGSRSYSFYLDAGG